MYMLHCYLLKSEQGFLKGLVHEKNQDLVYILKSLPLGIKIQLGIEEQACIQKKEEDKCSRVESRVPLSEVCHTDRTRTQEDTQLDWDKPTEAYL